MAALTTQNIVYAGTGPTMGSASTSDTAEVGQRRFAYYRNTGTQKTITVNVPGSTPYTAVNPDVQYTLAATTGTLMIPLSSDYNEGDGRTTITMSPDATGVTVAIVDANWEL